MPFDRSCRPFSFVRAFVMAGALVGAPVQAAQFCVSTGDQLGTALTTAEANGVSDEVRITTGLKQTTANLVAIHWLFQTSQDHDLVVSGGWNAGCSQQVAGPRATVLDGRGNAQVLSLRFGNDSAAAVTVRNLTLQNGFTSNNSATGGVAVTAVGTSAPAVVLERLIVRLNEAPNSLSGAVEVFTLENATGQYTLRNSVIEGNGQVGVQVLMGTGATAYINNNTITGNVASQGTTGGLRATGPGSHWLSNNAVAFNSGDQLAISASATAVILRNNLLGNIVGTPGLQFDTILGDPQWALDGQGFWRPLPGSPLIDSGFGSAVGGIGSQDIGGGVRVYGSAVDRGAREVDDTIFGHGFQ